MGVLSLCMLWDAQRLATIFLGVNVGHMLIAFQTKMNVLDQHRKLCVAVETHQTGKEASIRLGHKRAEAMTLIDRAGITPWALCLNQN